MNTWTRLLTLLLIPGWLGCVEDPALEQTSHEESEELITHEQALNMDLNVDWHDHDTLRVLFRFSIQESGNRRYNICVRPKGQGSGWDFCEAVYPDSNTFGCDVAGECTAVYFVPVQGACGDTQKIRVQEGRAPFFREVKWAELNPCGWHGGTFVPASGGYKAGCEIGPAAPAGTTGFLWANHFYHTPPSPGSCPLSGSTFDGLNCKVMPIPRSEGFVRWPGRFLYRPYNCPAP